MKKFVTLVAAAVLGATLSYAQTPKLEAVVAKDKHSKPTDSFAADVPKVYVFFKSKGTKSGDKVRSVWIAEDVGDAAPKGTTIDEATIALEKDDGSGSFSLSKPTKGWPVGEYRVDICFRDQVATSVKFTIKSGDESDKEDDDDEKD